MDLFSNDLSNDELGELLVATTIMNVGVIALWLHRFAGVL
jgi:hypothetical protein